MILYTFLDCLSTFYFLFIKFQCTFSNSYNLLAYYNYYYYWILIKLFCFFAEFLLFSPTE